MPPSDDLIEKVAEAFHRHYERLAPEYGYATRKESAVPWSEVPEANKALMRATVAAVIADEAAGCVLVPKDCEVEPKTWARPQDGVLIDWWDHVPPAPAGTKRVYVAPVDIGDTTDG